MKRKRFLLFLGLFLFAAIVLPLARMSALSRSSATVWYTSPPIDTEGMRLRFRVPANYTFRDCNVKDGYGMIRFRRNIPDGLTQIFTPSGMLDITIGQTLNPHSTANKPPLVLDYTTLNDLCLFCNSVRAAGRALYLPTQHYEIHLFYANDDRRVFDRNWREIMDSLTILP